MSRAPRVLVSGLVLGQPMGGVRRHNAELLPRIARMLEDRGGGLAVLEGRDRIAFDLPASVARIASDVPARPILVRALRESGALRRACDAARASGRPFDLVHSAHLPAPRGLDVPLTLTLHDLRALEPHESSIARRWAAQRTLENAVRRAARVFTVSEHVASELERRFHVSHERLTVIGNGVDHFTPLPRRAAPSAPIVCVGHIERRKNLELVVGALAHDGSLPDLHLHGAPKRGEDERLRALARELGVEARLRVLGPFDERDLARIYAESAVVVVPSWIEGFGITALEAQRARVPLAIARAGALTEVAGAETPGFSPENPAECAHAIHVAIASSATQLDAAERRANAHTWDAAARAWIDGWSSIA